MLKAYVDNFQNFFYGQDKHKVFPSNFFQGHMSCLEFFSS